jgi:hypothetical protein
MSPRPRLALLLGGGVLAAACAPGPGAPPAPETPPSPSSTCVVASDSAGAGRDVTAAFDDSADARRVARATRVVAPVRLDCEGRPSPGLAIRWSRDSSARFWTIDLDSPSTWTAGPLAAAWWADPDANSALRWAGVESLIPLDERRLVLGFSSPEAEPPTVLADRSLGVPPTSPRRNSVLPQPTSGDLRDAIDRGVDLVHTSDPGVIEYASRRPGLTSIPLPWNRVYLLLLPSSSAGVGAAIPPDTAAFRAALARDAVRADARAAAAPSWWERAGACPQVTPPSARRRQLANAVVYRASDRVARDLAERIVALAGAPELAARGLDDEAFRSALVSGSERAFVVAAPVHATVPCRESAGWPPSATVVPLIETRPHAILRRGTPPFEVEWDGTLVGR